MEKYCIKDSVLVVEQKQFITKDNQVIDYNEYNLLIPVNGNTLQLRFDKNNKGAIDTLITLGLIDKIK